MPNTKLLLKLHVNKPKQGGFSLIFFCWRKVMMTNYFRPVSTYNVANQPSSRSTPSGNGNQIFKLILTGYLLVLDGSGSHCSTYRYSDPVRCSGPKIADPDKKTVSRNPAHTTAVIGIFLSNFWRFPAVFRIRTDPLKEMPSGS